MGSASRTALAAAKSALSDQLASNAGGELLAASAELDKSPALLAALADSSAPAEAKTRVIERVFGSFSEGARAVLSVASDQAWSSPAEFVDGVEELGLRALALNEPGLADELLFVAKTIDSNHELELGLGSKLGDTQAKLAIIDKLFAARVGAGALSVAKHVVASPRGRRASAALRASAEIVADQQGLSLATVTVAAPIDEQQTERIARLLEQNVGRPVRVTTVIDQSLVGGVRIQLGDDVIDGSVRSRLDDLRLQLAG